MKVSVATCLCLFSHATAFAPMHRPSVAGQSLRLSDSETPEEPGGALVPIKEETVEFTAGLLGGVAGFAVGGPVLGAIGAAAGNYVSKMDGDVSEVMQAVSKSSIQIFNYLNRLDKKYELVDKAKTSLESALEKVKSNENVDPQVVEKVKGALSTTTEKISEINDEYDLVGGGMTALGIVGDLVEKSVKKAGELNEEYKLTDKALTALKGAVDKAKVAASEKAQETSENAPQEMA